MEFLIDLVATLFPRQIAHKLVSRFSELYFSLFHRRQRNQTAGTIVKAFKGAVSLDLAGTPYIRHVVFSQVIGQGG